MSEPASTGTGKYEELLATCRELTPVATAVAYPCEESALTAVIAGILRQRLARAAAVGYRLDKFLHLE